MKRLILCVGMMLLTFALGTGIQGLISSRGVHNAPPPKAEAISLAPVELRKEPVAPIPPVPAATPTPILVLDYDPNKFRLWAIFYIMGPKPGEFADIETLEVALDEHDGHGPGHISVYTCSRDNDCDDASAVFALVTDQRLFFTTSQLRNSQIEYRFDGKFLRTDFNALEGKNVAVLRGTLTKTKNGRKIAEHTFNFRMEHLGC